MGGGHRLEVREAAVARVVEVVEEAARGGGKQLACRKNMPELRAKTRYAPPP